MSDFNNLLPIERQLNIGDNKGPIYFARQSRISLLFKKLNDEVNSSEKFTQFLDELDKYITRKDVIGLEKKLSDGGFNGKDILRAEERKEMFWKKAEKGILYPSARKIYSVLLAKIITDFEVYIEPLINRNESKDKLIKELSEKIINPIFDLLNTEAGEDDLLFLNSEEIYGMVYYLTGRCHLNWINYDTLSSSI